MPAESRNTKTQDATEARRLMRHLAVALGAAGLLATVFTAWTPASLNPSELVAQLAAAVSGDGAESESASGGITGPLFVPDERRRVGVVAGHSGIDPTSGLSDPGSVCDDGLTEAEVNLEIARLVVRGLEAAGYTADLLEEWDTRLTGYRALALVSVHADSCMWINDQATGYKIASAIDSSVAERTDRLVSCMVDRYARATDLDFRPGSITRDMTEYHSFNEIHNQTPAAIIETGFLYLDREFLTNEPERAASGIVAGVLCYLNNEPTTLEAGATP
jgi:N-acetylmuramoyl-L-alanine amidase